MNSANEYRSNAEECLRMAQSAPDERDKPLWVTMAQSWLRLAEHADRIKHDVESAKQESPGEPEAAEASGAR